jgi:hypothetical protein
MDGGAHHSTLPTLTHTRNSSPQQVWWVLRTLYNFIVERRLPFRVVSPLCDWDVENNRYLPYATVATAPDLAGQDPFAPERFAFSRERVEGESALLLV